MNPIAMKNINPKKKARSYCDFKKKHFFKKKKVKKVINVVVIIFLQTLKLILKLMKRVCFFLNFFFDISCRVKIINKSKIFYLLERKMTNFCLIFGYFWILIYGAVFTFLISRSVHIWHFVLFSVFFSGRYIVK